MRDPRNEVDGHTVIAVVVVVVVVSDDGAVIVVVSVAGLAPC